MGIKKYRPVTSTLRFKTVVDYGSLTKKKPEKHLTHFKKSTGGRNNCGHITVRHRGGGAKRKYRIIDFKRDKVDIPAKVKAIEYDPNRSAFLALLSYADGEKRYILAPLDIKVGDEVVASDTADIKIGNTLKMKNIPTGTLVHNLEVRAGKGGQLVRTAGSSAQILAKEGDYCQVRMPSGEVRSFHMMCKASIGQVGNADHENVKWGSAGSSRRRGIRPSVRGVVMNPVDHPMGGGEGRASGGIPRSPWGWCAKGLKTRKNKRTNRFIVKRRGKK